MRYRTGFLRDPAPLFYDDLLPDRSSKGRVVLVHGGCLTGACYLNTPDDRLGWAHAFLAHNYRVLVPDWPGAGRSAAIPPDKVTGELVCEAIGRLLDACDGDVVLLVHSMSGPFGFRLVETHGDRIKALIAVAPGPPGNIQPEPVVLAETNHDLEIQGTASRWRIPKRGLWWPTESFARDKMIGSSVRFPFKAFDPFYRQLVALPAGLLSERQNVHGSQLRVHDPARFPGKPVLVLTGDRDTDHSRAADAATADWLVTLGADVTFRFLDDPIYKGNGHVLMGEDNSDAIAELIIAWLDERA